MRARRRRGEEEDDKEKLIAPFLGHLTLRIAPCDARRAVIFAPSWGRRAERPRPRRAMRDYLCAPGGDLALPLPPSSPLLSLRQCNADLVALSSSRCAQEVD